MAQWKYEQYAARVGGEQPEWHRLDPKESQARITAEVRLNAPRNDLARSVRAAAGATENEAEFVRRLRRSGILVRPRFAEGATDVITAYSVARKPTDSERPIWYGGGQMGRDLTLPRLREGWPDTPAGATDAAAFAAWSNAVEKTPGDLAEASDALAKSAQTYRRPVKPQRAGRVAMSGAMMLLASVARGGQGTAAQLAMLCQLMNLSQAVYDAARAVGEARQAANVLTTVRERAMNVRRQLDAAPAAAATSTSTAKAPKVDRLT